MKIDSGDDIVAEINVTPLVDVVLVLLIIFIVTARFTLPPSIKVDLPRAASSDAAGEAPATAMVTLKPGGELFLDETSITADQLPARLAELHAKNAAAQLVINADENVLHGAVVRVLDQAKRAGIDKVAISIEEKPQ
ncbi:MAG: ExbD/TolR family protein [Elusimicrobiota bacterium]